MKKLPKLITDKLRVFGWKEYAGDNPMYKHHWVKDRLVLHIEPGSMRGMFHTRLLTDNDHNPVIKFVNLHTLEAMIEEMK